MTFQEMALAMMHMWMLGVFVMLATWYSGHKHLLRIDFKTVGKWTLFLGGLSIFRALMFLTPFGREMLLNANELTSFIPWQGILFVFWEDAAHTLPLVLLAILMGNRWFSKPISFIALIAMMIDFGAGHMYQGVWTAILLSFYVPLTLNIAKEKGFGTVMICHIIYDLCTIFLIRYMAGL